MPAATRRARRAELALALGLVGGLLGCHRAGAPARVLDDYYGHLRDGRIAAAYALTTPAYRARRDLRAFALVVARQPILSPRERHLSGDAIAIELSAPGVEAITVTGAKHGPLYLASDPRTIYPVSTPEAALRSFARAIALGRRERAIELCAPALHDRFGPVGTPLPDALLDLARRIAAQLTADAPPIVIDAQGARWLLGDGRSITLERARAGWALAGID